ncbi:pentatricopeptide repeat-containing protein At2g33760-like [Musa acuminata AAA Group]|uniref:pentatricopeptide repeat-containing protein At2g33760-like n=1 Tax=Musa acuminata AAA Group TaxID=214697 RepID=UPI0031D94BCF
MGAPLDIPSYAALLDATSASRDLATLRRAHGRLLVGGLAHHRFLRSKLCAAYARCSRLPEARHLILLCPRPSAFLLNSLLRADAPRSALLLFHRMLSSRSPPPDSRSFASALHHAAALSSLRVGRLLHAAAFASGLLLDPDPLVPNSLVAMYSKCGDLASARRVFDRMSRRSVASWTAMIAACGAHGQAPDAVALLGGMVADVGEAGLDGAAMTAVLAACARGDAAEAEVGRRVFEMMREGRFGGVRPGLEHYTCMVDMLGRAGRVEEAEALIGEMDGEPDDALWAALLGACRAHGRLDVAERVADLVYGHTV